MGNVIPNSKLDNPSSHRIRNGPLINVNTEIHKLTQYGHNIIELNNKTKKASKNKSIKSCFKLIDLYPYLTYDASINNITSSLTLLENLANIISLYAGIKNNINKTFQFKVHIDNKHKSHQMNKPYFNYIKNEYDDIFTNILAGSSWNGLVYLITPINNKNINAKLYMIDGGYFPPKSKQSELPFHFASSQYLLDPNLCCVVSHIVGNDDNNDNDPRSAMIIDGIILVNYRLDTIYGYHMVNNNNGLFILKQFASSTKTITMTYDADNDNIDDMDGYDIISVDKDETVINLWRQNIDAFILTSKFNLYGIRIQQNKFKMAKICTFTEALKDITDIAKYVDCWYDIDTKILFLIYKNMNAQTVQFKMYQSDRIIPSSSNYNNNDDVDSNATIVWEKDNDSMSNITKSVNMDIVKPLQNSLDYNYLICNKSVLFYHKSSETLLLFFSSYLIQMTIDFDKRQLIKVNVGIIDDMEYEDKSKFDEDRKQQQLRMNMINTANQYIANNLFHIDNQNMSINSDIINENPLPVETSICDHIIGYDELRSCIILNFNQYEKELSTLYKFQVNVRRATDFASDWKKILPLS